ncbi:hypothetical protein WCE04_27070 [Pseudomonas shirazica]
MESEETGSLPLQKQALTTLQTIPRCASSGAHQGEFTESIALEGKAMSQTFEQGWAARPFAQQFPEMNADEAKRLDHINTSITTLYLAGLLTDKQANEIRTKKFPKVVTKAVLGKR